MGPKALVRPLVLDRRGNPVMSAQRQAHATALYSYLRGGYEGAGSGTALKSWGPTVGSADGDIIGDLATLRARTRDLCRNSPIAAGAQKTYVRNIVGTGLRPQPNPDHVLLGITAEEAKSWARQAKKLWSFYAKTPACDVEGRRTFAQMLRVLVASEFESGDAFTVRRAVPRRGDPFWTRLQVIEADRVCNPDWTPDSDTLKAGIETDGNGRPTRCHIMNQHPGDRWLRGGSTWVSVPWFGDRSGLPMVLQNWNPTRPGQTRGVPVLAPVILALKQVSRYTEAAIMAAVVQNLFTVFVEAPPDETGSPQGLAALAADGANAGSPADQPTGEYRLGEGTMIDLRPGEKVQFADPTHPNPNFDAFITAILRQIGAAIETPYEMLVQQFLSSYSAARGVVLEAWRAVYTHRSRLTDQTCQPTYEWFIEEMVVRGLISAPGFLEDPFARAAWLGCTWTGDAAPQIDPLKEITAAKERVNLSVSTLAIETSELEGEDWDDVVEQRGREVAKLRELGLLQEQMAERIVTEPVQPKPAPDTEDEDEDQADEADRKELAHVG